MRSTRVPRTCLTLIGSLLLALAFAQSAIAAKVVAIGEVNGDYDVLVEVLMANQLLGDDLTWSGGATQVVSLGNVVGAGDGSVKALELLMRLSFEASEADGAVHIVMGKNELHAIAGGGNAHGEYLMSLPALVKIDDTVYAHSGLSPDMGALGIDGVNSTLATELSQNAASWQGLPHDQLKAKVDELKVLGVMGPVRYRGSCECYAVVETGKVQTALDALGASRVVVSQKAYPDYRVISRMDGRVIIANTGMGSGAEGARASAVIVENGNVSAQYGTESQAPLPEPRRVGPRPAALTDDDLEDFLAHGEVVDIEDVGEGVTRPRRVTLRQDGVQIRAIFHTEDTKPKNKRETNLSDRFQYNAAAYRVDRLIDLGMTPVTVLREVDGTPGSLMFWVDGLINEIKRRDLGLKGTFWCKLVDQHHVLNAWDILIFNEDRTYQNIQYTESNWLLILIDHSRAFRIDNSRPLYLKKAKLKYPQELADRLATFDQDQLYAAIGDIVDRNQLKSLLKRRDGLLKDRE